MSRLLAKWLENEVVLSQSVTSFEDDFANGYLLGELLDRLHLPVDTSSLRDEGTPKAVTDNFRTVGHALRNAGVILTPAHANEIMTAQPGASMRLIYQIKMAASKLARSRRAKTEAEQPVLTTGDFKRKARFEETERARFERSVEKAAFGNLKDADMFFHLQHFEDDARAREERVRQLEERDRQLEEERLAARREAVRMQYKSLVDSRHAAEELGTEQWKRNLQKRRKAEKRDLRTELTVRERQERARRTAKQREAMETTACLEEFERTLEHVSGTKRSPHPPGRLAPSRSVQGKEGATEFLKSLDRDMPSSVEQNKRAQQEMNRIRDKTRSDRAARKERQRRRRKVLADLQRMGDSAEAENHQIQLLAKVQRESAEERRMAEEIWRIQQFEEVVRENRRVRDRQHAAQRDADYRAELQRDRELHRAEREAFEHRLRQHRERKAERDAEMSTRQHESNAHYCNELVHSLVGLAVQAASYRALNDTPVVPETVWSQWMAVFARHPERLLLDDGDATESEPEDEQQHEEQSPEDAAEDTPQDDIARWVELRLAELAKVSDNNAQMLDDVAVEEYLEHRGIWEGRAHATALADVPIRADDPQPLPVGVDAQEDDASPAAQSAPPSVAAPDSDAILGSIVQKVVDVASGVIEEPPFPQVPERPIAVCVLGKPFAGKRTLAAALQERHDLQVVNVDALLEQGLAEVAERKANKTKKKKGDMTPFDQAVQAAAKLVAKGKQVSDEVYVDLIKAHVAEPASAGGYVLVNFPRTARQAELLEVALSGFTKPKRPPAGPPEPTKSKRDRVDSKIAPPPEPTELPGTPYPSAFDLVLWLDSGDEAAARRALGRRIDPVTGEEFHLESFPPPDDEAIKERLQRIPGDEDLEAKLPDMFASYRDEQTALDEWFAPFATLHTLNAEADQLAVARGASDLIRDIIHKQEEARLAAEKQKEAEEAAAREAAQREAAQADAAVDDVADELTKMEAKAAELKQDSEAPKGKKGKGKKGKGKGKGSAAVPELDPLPIEQEAEQPAPESAEPAGEEADPLDMSNFLDFRDEAVAKLLAERWNAAERRYLTGLRRAFRALRREEHVNLRHFALLRHRFLRFLCRPDQKMELVQVFQDKFNVVDAALRHDAEAKGELHQRTDELGDQLWAICEQRKDEAEAELALIRDDGWVPAQAARLAAEFVFLAQLEVDRYFESLRLAADFCAVLSGLPLPVYPSEQPEEDDGEVSVFGAPTLPLPALVQSAVDALQGGDEEPKKKGKAKKGKKGKKGKGGAEADEAPQDALAGLDASVQAALASRREYSAVEPALLALAAPVDLDAAAAGGKKKKKDHVVEASADVQLSQRCAAQLAATVDAENRILETRLQRLQQVASELIGRVQVEGERQLRSLDRWFGLRLQGENASIDALVHTVKQAIEAETPLYYDLELRDEDLLVNQALLAENLPRVPRSGAFDELVRQADAELDLSPTQLSILAQHLNATCPGGLVSARELVDFFVRLAGTTFAGSASSPLPPAWIRFTKSSYERLAAKLYDEAATPSRVIDCMHALACFALPADRATPSAEALSTWLSALREADEETTGRVSVEAVAGTASALSGVLGCGEDEARAMSEFFCVAFDGQYELMVAYLAFSRETLQALEVAGGAPAACALPRVVPVAVMSGE